MSSKDELKADLKIKGIFDNSNFPTLQTWVIYMVIALYRHFVMEMLFLQIQNHIENYQFDIGKILSVATETNKINEELDQSNYDTMTIFILIVNFIRSQMLLSGEYHFIYPNS